MIARKRRRAGAATPTRRNTSLALDRAGRATLRPPTLALVREGGRPGAGRRVRETLLLAAAVVLDWVTFFIRRRGDRWFAMNDAEAYWRSWQIIKTRGGLGRRYRDLRFDPEEPAINGGRGHHGPFGSI